MWISGTSQYAIRAVVYVATHGAESPVRVGPMAEALSMPRNYLSKTLHLLARAGVLKSERGPRGGFQLAIPIDTLTLARVAAPFDDLGGRHCLLGRAQCGSKNPCAAHGQWSAIADQLQRFFAETTVHDLMKNPRADARPRFRKPAAARRPKAR